MPSAVPASVSAAWPGGRRPAGYRPGLPPANHSCGLQVAALAGIPPAVVRQARQHLQELERQTASKTTPVRFEPQLPLAFTTYEPHPAVETLTTLDPDALTPRQALEVLYRLKALIG